jgi:hypothetical protein
MGLVPLAWCAFRRERQAVWWWIAVAFAVSWVADIGARFGNPWLPAAVYPISQVGIIAVVLAHTQRAGLIYVLLLTVAGMVSVLWEGVSGPVLLLEAVAAGVVIDVLWNRPELGRLRWVLWLAFVGGLLPWIGYLLAPSLVMWVLWQAVRAASLGLFCWASAAPRPELRVA